MTTAFKAGLIQTNVSNEMAENVAFVREQARLARDAGADFIMTPENTGLIGANRTETLVKAETEESHAMLAAARAAGRILNIEDMRPQTEDTHTMLAAACASARETGTWFLLGSIHVRVPGEEQIRNRSYLIDAAGGIVASYDKIHMFDVQLAGGESYRESSTFKPGEKSVLAETPWGVLGMTICYDLRFPYLYRDLAHAGATMLAIPSSFTVPTGQAHWHTPFDRRGAMGRGAGRCRRREGRLRHCRRRCGQDRRGAQDGAVADARSDVRRARAAQAVGREGRRIVSPDRGPPTRNRPEVDSALRAHAHTLPDREPLPRS